MRELPVDCRQQMKNKLLARAMGWLENEAVYGQEPRYAAAILTYINGLGCSPTLPQRKGAQPTQMSDTPKTTMFAGLPEANELARDIRDAKRYRALRRVHLEHLDADDYGYACEDWDKQCDVLVAKCLEFDNQGIAGAAPRATDRMPETLASGQLPTKANELRDAEYWQDRALQVEAKLSQYLELQNAAPRAPVSASEKDTPAAYPGESSPVVAARRIWFAGVPPQGEPE